MPTVFIMTKQREAMERGALNIWTVYDHPLDFPNSYVARRFEVKGREPLITGDIVQSDTLAMIRKSFSQCGMTCLPRSDDDDPKIIETWL